MNRLLVNVCNSIFDEYEEPFNVVDGVATFKTDYKDITVEASNNDITITTNASTVGIRFQLTISNNNQTEDEVINRAVELFGYVLDIEYN